MENELSMLPTRRQMTLAAVGLGASLLTGCGTDLFSSAHDDLPFEPVQEQAGPAPDDFVVPQGASIALTAKDYRLDAAKYLYARNEQRIYKGKLPPFLYAVGVLDVTLDRSGNVISTRWARAPAHAPEVMAEIIRTVKEASPLPAPARLGPVIYRDVWLWHKSGKFQLDTLSEGQV